MNKNARNFAIFTLLLIFVIAFSLITTTDTLKFNITTDSKTDVQGDNLEAHFIDVGQGDAILITQGNHNMLIDAGDNKYEKAVVDYLKKQGVKKLDYVIGTHPHADHIGGLDAVIDAFEIGKIIMPKVEHTTKTFLDVLTSVKNKRLKVTTPNVGDKYKLGEAEFIIAAPNSKNYLELNNYSIVTRMEYGKISFLFTGDAEVLSEMEILNNKINIEADVLKMGHHGSDTSSSDEFLDTVKPKYAVIQVGEGNKYGHPAAKILNKLEKRNIKIYRNDLDGNIIAISDGNEIIFNLERNLKKNNQPKESEEPYKEYDIYIGNKNSKVFHVDTCNSLPIENNRKYFETFEEAVSAGYTPCSRCISQ
ncbi:MAG: MBL fold metallo-hydrolase [Firmicutes bacterium]|nr:MBL fold metallo-hydrolase [Bacillota bacterium]